MKTTTPGLAWLMISSPSRAAQACRRPETLRPAAILYAAFILGSLAFSAFKPHDFPDKNAVLPPARGPAFWIRAAFWQLPMEAAWIAGLMGLVRFFSAGRMGARLLGSVLWAGAAVAIVALFKEGVIGKVPFLLGSAAWMALFAPFLRLPTREDWSSLISFMMGINAIGLLMVPVLAMTVHQRSFHSYTTVQALMGLWVLGAGTLGLRELSALRLPRAFMCMFFSLVFQAVFCFTLYFAGLFPHEVMTALFYG